ncbi:hypothetical protein CLF_107556 [Clonorchis sinensis]|uniref:Uncharacterized protein n=1 Tax=Clonorchis sinensis TaxID=79923 RepID=G7YQS7_CLOSI|nr:hypothetical protein CLF_107556 [Clonorchis sinensis]
MLNTKPFASTNIGPKAGPGGSPAGCSDNANSSPNSSITEKAVAIINDDVNGNVMENMRIFRGFFKRQVLWNSYSVGELADVVEPDKADQDSEADSDDARWNGDVNVDGDGDDIDDEEIDNDYCQAYFDNGEGDLSDDALGGDDDDGAWQLDCKRFITNRGDIVSAGLSGPTQPRTDDVTWIGPIQVTSNDETFTRIHAVYRPSICGQFFACNNVDDLNQSINRDSVAFTERNADHLLRLVEIVVIYVDSRVRNYVLPVIQRPLCGHESTDIVMIEYCLNLPTNTSTVHTNQQELLTGTYRWFSVLVERDFADCMPENSTYRHSEDLRRSDWRGYASNSHLDDKREQMVLGLLRCFRSPMEILDSLRKSCGIDLTGHYQMEAKYRRLAGIPLVRSQQKSATLPSHLERFGRLTSETKEQLVVVGAVSVELDGPAQGTKSSIVVSDATSTKLSVPKGGSSTATRYAGIEQRSNRFHIYRVVGRSGASRQSDLLLLTTKMDDDTPKAGYAKSLYLPELHKDIGSTFLAQIKLIESVLWVHVTHSSAKYYGYGELRVIYQTGYGSRDTVIATPYLGLWTSPYMNILGEAHEFVKRYVYIRSCISSDCSVTNEVDERICNARVAFANLKHPWRQSDLSLNINKRCRLRSIPLSLTADKYASLFSLNFAALNKAYCYRISLLNNRCTHDSLIITNETNCAGSEFGLMTKTFAVLRMIWRTFSRIARTDFQILYGAYVRPLLEYANPVVYSGRTKDVILIERVQRAATKMVAGLKSMDYETRLAVLDLFPLEYRRLRGDLILTYALFEQGLATGERQLLNDKNKTDPGNLGESLDSVYQSVNP